MGCCPVFVQKTGMADYQEVDWQAIYSLNQPRKANKKKDR
jgi:hypothetical protein